MLMLESFERFRRTLRETEMMTFDELYARAAMSLALPDRESGRDGTLGAGASDSDDDGWSYDEVPF